MEMKIPLVAISAFVVVVVLAAVLMPVLGDAQKTEDTFTNEGYYHMSILDDSSTYKLYWDHTLPYQITLNDTDVIPLTGLSNYQAVTLIGSANFTFRFYNVSDNPRVQLYGGTGYGFGGASVTAGTDLTVTISGGNITFVNNAESPLNVTAALPSPTYAVTTTGDYVMKKANTNAYVLEDTSIIVLCGLTESGGAQAGVYATGTVEDGLDYTLFRPAADSETAVFSDETITYTDVSDHVGLVSLEKVNFSVTVTAGTLTPTYTYFIVPSEVTAERTVHLDPNEIALLGAIPALVIVALLIGVLAIFMKSRMD